LIELFQSRDGSPSHAFFADKSLAIQLDGFLCEQFQNLNFSERLSILQLASRSDL